MHSQGFSGQMPAVDRRVTPDSDGVTSITLLFYSRSVTEPNQELFVPPYARACNGFLGVLPNSGPCQTCFR